MKPISLLIVVACLLSGLFIALPVSAAKGAVQIAKPSVIRLTPAAPVFDQKTRQAEVAERRARLAEAVGPKGVLILFSARPRVYTGDVDYEYRQENNLYYLTNLKQAGAILVMLPGNPTTPEILFIPRSNPFLETWNGHITTPAEANQASGLTEIWEAGEFEPFINALKNRQPYRPEASKILMSSIPASTPPASSGNEQLFAAAVKNEATIFLMAAGGRESYEYPQEQKLAAEWTGSLTGFNVRSAVPLFVARRQRKSGMEIAFLQHAIDITSEAQQRAWIAAGEAKWEYEVEALISYTFRLRNADHWGFPSIVGCGPNTTTLHYEELQGPCKPGDLLLMDIGAEYEHYSADVTRTIPINGKFSTDQAAIYQVVFNAQEAAAKATRPGIYLSDVDRAATGVVKDGLLKLGLITDQESSQYRIWFMHSTCHWLGMNVHDVGNFGAKLEPGMVFTNEPGIYVRTDALDYKPFDMSEAQWEKFKSAVRPSFEKYKGIGIRIEDDMLVTADGAKWMTGSLPRAIPDIEGFIARGRSGL